MSVPNPTAARKVVAFCPWVEFQAKPFEMCGVRVMGFSDAEHVLDEDGRTALWRAPRPYGDIVLAPDRTPQSWNRNPLLYTVTPDRPLQEPAPNQARLISLANDYLYVSAFATNRPGPGGLQFYTNAADWALYFQPVQSPDGLAFGLRRLFGIVHAGGYSWDRSHISQPIECNRCALHERGVDRTIVDGVSALNASGRAVLYLSPTRSFIRGTSDHHLWGREEDLAFLWGAIEQTRESAGFESCGAAQADVDQWAATLKINPAHSTALIRGVVGSAPLAEYVWDADFRPRADRGDSPLTKARRLGVEFSALERALDELNFARNKMLHEGVLPPLEWDTTTLAFLASRFWVALFKRLLGWEGVRQWTEDDDCEVRGLQAFATHGRTSFLDGHAAYERAVDQCHRDRVQRQALEHLRRLLGEERYG